ncbi:hypothetical protein HMPREF1611_05611 [Escherichia coli 908573]|nr:hypothetical protein HMPREF1611_05611 [Escherichia coli 908573]
MPHRALPLRGRSAVLRIEPVPVSPRLRGQRPLTPPAFGLRAPLGRPHPAPDSPGRKRPPRPFGVPTPFRRRHPLPVRYCVIRGLCSSAGRWP